jgi:hypothetical protein
VQQLRTFSEGKRKKRWTKPGTHVCHDHVPTLSLDNEMERKKERVMSKDL